MSTAAREQILPLPVPRQWQSVRVWFRYERECPRCHRTGGMATVRLFIGLSERCSDECPDRPHTHMECSLCRQVWPTRARPRRPSDDRRRT